MKVRKMNFTHTWLSLLHILSCPSAIDDEIKDPSSDLVLNP